MQKIKEILVAGCSHAYGAETIADCSDHPDSINFAYAKHLADRLKCKYVNIASNGISNFEIAKRLQQYIDFKITDYNNLFVIIGWTDYDRFSFMPEAYIKKNNTNPLAARLLNITSSELFVNNLITLLNTTGRKTYFLQKIKELNNGECFLDFMRMYIFKTSYYADMNYSLRTMITNYLKSKKINHLTFSAHKPAKYYNTIKYEKILDNGHNLLEYTHNFCQVDNFKKYGIMPGNHLSREAHLKVADFLYEKIANGVGFIKRS